MNQDHRKDFISYNYKTHGQIPSETLDQIKGLVISGGGVGMSYIQENLQTAFLIGYALDREGKVLGTVTLKRPKSEYRKKIEAAGGWDLSGYLERGYTSVRPDCRGRGIADTLIKGLIERSKGEKIYTTIRMDHASALRLTRKNGMRLAATFTNWRTDREIGLFINQ